MKRSALPLFALALALGLAACQTADDPAPPASDPVTDDDGQPEALALGDAGAGCPANRHLCSNLGGCVSNNSPRHCGVACVPCNGIPHGKATCIAVRDAHVCSAKCNSGFKMCHFECIPSRQRCN